MTFFLMFVILAVATDARAVGEAAAIAIGALVALDRCVRSSRALRKRGPFTRGPFSYGKLWLDRCQIVVSLR